MTPKEGDRIIIKNVPNDYPFKDLYKGLGTVQDHFGSIPDGSIPFFTGYEPFKKKGDAMRFMSCSGSGFSAPITALTYEGEKPAPFWQFKDGEMKAHNGETYQEVVSYWSVEFKAVL
jgi:hypothetical protein